MGVQKIYEDAWKELQCGNPQCKKGFQVSEMEFHTRKHYIHLCDKCNNYTIYSTEKKNSPFEDAGFGFKRLSRAY